jgi:hypothetical protein
MVLYTKFHSRNQLSIISLSARERESYGVNWNWMALFLGSAERGGIFIFYFLILRLKNNKCEGFHSFRFALIL